jgi:hypothetical protein
MGAHLLRIFAPVSKPWAAAALVDVKAKYFVDVNAKYVDVKANDGAHELNDGDG